MKKLIFGILCLVAFSWSAVGVVHAAFDPLNVACNAAGDAAGADAPLPAACDESQSAQPDSTGADADNPIISTINRVANIISVAVGVISVIIIIIAGITMTLSQGEAGAIKSSRDAIIYAAVGLVVIAVARLIVMFVVNNI